MSHKFRIGERVIWRGAWGQEPPREALVIGRHYEGNEPVYDLASGHWAYERQLSTLPAEVIATNEFRRTLEAVTTPILELHPASNVIPFARRHS